MRRLVLLILVAALSSGCALLSDVEGNAGIVCQNGVGPGERRDGDPLAAGEPMAGLDVTSMSPSDVGRAAVGRGLAVTWRYLYQFGAPVNGEVSAYSECWCIAPPDGRVEGLAYDSTGGLVIFVESGKTLAAARQQPRLGWGCNPEADARSHRRAVG